MTLSSIFFALIAGVITVSSPCVLPILPIVLSSSLKKNKWYPLLMILGLALNFSLLGVLFGAFGKSIGISKDLITDFSIFVLLLMGIIIVSDTINGQFTKFITPLISNFSKNYTKKEDTWWEAMLLGMILGVVWAPCAGPILASILALAASTQSIVGGFVLLFVYSIGAGIPMLVLAYGGQRMLKGSRLIVGKSKLIKKSFGWILILTALLLYLGIFKKIEAALIPYLPDFITSF